MKPKQVTYSAGLLIAGFVFGILARPLLIEDDPIRKWRRAIASSGEESAKQRLIDAKRLHSEEPIAASLGDVLECHDANPARFDIQYKGKVFRFSGEVTRIDVGTLSLKEPGAVSNNLFDITGPPGVSAILDDSQKQDIANLQKGGRATVTGLIFGVSGFSGDLFLNPAVMK